MNQVSIVFDTIEKYPLVVLGFGFIVVAIGGVMYRVLLQPKLKRIEEVANGNTTRILDIKDDLNVKHFELKSDIKELVKSMGDSTQTLMKGLMSGVSDQIASMNHHNEAQHNVLFEKVEVLVNNHHDIDKRITILEKK